MKTSPYVRAHGCAGIWKRPDQRRECRFGAAAGVPEGRLGHTPHERHSLATGVSGVRWSDASSAARRSDGGAEPQARSGRVVGYFDST